MHDKERQDPAPNAPETQPTYEEKPSYEELEARAAAMREALEDVWSVCSREHWRQVGEALKPEAGQKVLKELEKTRYERDLLRHPLRDIVPFLDRHDSEVLLSRDPTVNISEEDEECIEIEVQLGTLRDARKALQAVEATPEKISRMREALQSIGAYKDYLCEEPDTIKCKETELGILSKKIPYVAYEALLFSSLPEPPGIVVNERLAEARHYEQTLREIAARGADFSMEQPEEEISHALMVEIPHDANQALSEHESHQENPGPLEEPDHDQPSDPDWIPF